LADVGKDPTNGTFHKQSGAFSAKNSSGASEREPATRFVQARLRFGAEQWDPPELFFDPRTTTTNPRECWLICS